MAELKTQVNDGDVKAFLNTAPENRRADGLVLLELFNKITHEQSKMWGTSIQKGTGCSPASRPARPRSRCI